MNYEEWLKTVPAEITQDSLWQKTVYRQALFLCDLAWVDICKLISDHRTIRLSDQLYRSAGSISANLAEGYSHSSPKDQARFYEYSLGSARETRDWYYKARHILGDEVYIHRVQLITHIIRQLLSIIPTLRSHSVKEAIAEYEITHNDDLFTKVPVP